VCGKFSTCVYDYEKCQAHCECIPGYKSDGDQCLDLTPPVIKFHSNPVIITQCIVCSAKIEVVDGTKPISKENYEAYDVDYNPENKESNGEFRKIDLSDKVRLVDVKTIDDTHFVHTYEVADQSGNVARESVDVQIITEDLRLLIAKLADLHDRLERNGTYLGEKLIEQQERTSHLATMYWGLIFILLVFGWKVISFALSQIWILLQINARESVSFEDYKTARRFWLAIVKPFENSDNINRQIYNEYFNKD